MVASRTCLDALFIRNPDGTIPAEVAAFIDSRTEARDTAESAMKKYGLAVVLRSAYLKGVADAAEMLGADRA